MKAEGQKQTTNNEHDHKPTRQAAVRGQQKVKEWTQILRGYPPPLGGCRRLMEYIY